MSVLSLPSHSPHMLPMSLLSSALNTRLASPTGTAVTSTGPSTEPCMHPPLWLPGELPEPQASLCGFPAIISLMAPCSPHDIITPQSILPASSLSRILPSSTYTEPFPIPSLILLPPFYTCPSLTRESFCLTWPFSTTPHSPSASCLQEIRKLRH